MISEILVRNYILIPELHLQFEDGMSVLTGETGAGKSIIVGALNLVFGKSSTQQIAYNPELNVYLEITFRIDQENSELLAFLEEAGIDKESSELIIAREISPAGKSISFLNGRKTSISVLKELHDLLIDFHHQRDQQKLLNPGYQLDLLDQYGKLIPLRQTFKQMFSELKTDKQALLKLEEEEQRNNQLVELYRFQLNELSGAGLTLMEDTELQQEFELLSHSEEIINLTYKLYESLYESDSSVYDTLNQTYGNISKFTEMSPEIEDISQRILGIVNEVQDVSRQIQTLNERIASDPVRLEDIRNRIDLINSLKKKYRVSTLSELAEYQARITEFIGTRETNLEAINKLSQKMESNLSRLIETAELLSRNRQTAATALGMDIENKVQQLAIPNAHLEIQIDKKAHGKILMSDFDRFYTETGQDSIDFLFSANLGSPVSSMKNIASGGELSRILLAAKKALSVVMPSRTIILDEIDTGIGGKTAGSLAGFIHTLASRHQVICITHLAKIAAIADAHFCIEKKATATTTEIDVVLLSEENRVNEIARMLSGQITELSLKHAKELLQ